MRRHKIRNPVAQSPLLRKGGAHVQSKSGQRKRIKNQIKQELNDWKHNDVQKPIQNTIKNEGNQGVILFFMGKNGSLKNKFK